MSAPISSPNGGFVGFRFCIHRQLYYYCCNSFNGLYSTRLADLHRWWICVTCIDHCFSDIASARGIEVQSQIPCLFFAKSLTTKQLFLHFLIFIVYHTLRIVHDFFSFSFPTKTCNILYNHFFIKKKSRFLHCTVYIICINYQCNYWTLTQLRYRENTSRELVI